MENIDKELSEIGFHKLTPSEVEEFIFYANLNIKKLELTYDQFFRLRWLKKKLHNDKCINPDCEGYVGESHETNCPKCDTLLFKVGKFI